MKVTASLRLGQIASAILLTLVTAALSVAQEYAPALPATEAPAPDQDSIGKEPSKPEAKPADRKEEACPNPWAKIPPVRIWPRPGFFQMPPQGPGYYSALDVLEHNWRDKPPRFPYPSFALIQFPFFDADFRYLDDPKNTQHDHFDPLHRLHPGDNWLFATGGQASWRHMHEINSRLSGRDNDYDLTRLRIFGDLWYQDKFRAYVEFLDARTFNQDLAPLAPDATGADLLNAFIDVKIADIDDYPAYVRFGRQELLLGSQRLISPPDWLNVRRTFQGVRAFRQGEKFDVDLFWVQPVVPDSSAFDSVDNDQNFVGAWTTYRPQKGHFLDKYYLFLDNTSPARALGENQAVPYNVHTIGGRYAGDKNQFLWDVEGMFQLGERGNQSIVAGAFTVGGGYHFKDLPWNPTLWAYYDYASGDDQPGRGNYGTFNQLFPFGHYYLGWLDLVGRQNIQDVNFHLYLYPAKWITVWTQYHCFRLASANDALYNAAGVPLRRDVTGRAGNNVGQELDFIVNFHLGSHSDILVGYSHLFAGDFLRNTAANAAAGDDPELFYLMYSYRW